jgi:cytochrome c oxidase subunit 2
MESTVEVLSKEEFEKWYTDTTLVVAVEGEEAAPGAEGFAILTNQGCNACHSSDGTRLVGPSYLGVWGKERVVVENGEEKTVTADEEYITRSVYQPDQQVVKGFQRGLMQSYEGIISEEDIAKIIEYLSSLDE